MTTTKNQKSVNWLLVCRGVPEGTWAVTLLLVVMGVSCISPFYSESESELPVTDVITVSIRESALFEGGVLRLSNITDKQLRNVRVLFKNRDTQQTEFHELSIEPWAVAEIGVLEAGWVVIPNETITVSLDGYTFAAFETYRAKSGVLGIRPE